MVLILQESPKTGSDGGRLGHNNKMEQVVMDGKYRDLVKLINLQRDKLNNQQVEMTKVCLLVIPKLICLLFNHGPMCRNFLFLVNA